MPKDTSQDEITCEIKGDTFYGRRVITGKRVKYQTIYYAEKEDADSTRYTMDRQPDMDGKAKLILWQMVKQHHNL